MNQHSEFGNQTEFALEEPLFSPAGTAAPEKEVVKKVSVVWWKKKPLVIGLIAGVTLFVIVLLLFINMLIEASKRPQVPEPIEASATPAPATEPLVTRIESIETNLKSADPNQPQFAFPAVDLSIRIDEKPR